MRDNSVISQFTARVSPAQPRSETEEAPQPELELAEDLGAFGWLRGVRDRSIMLELRRRDGNVVALGYSWLERVELDRSHGITLRFAGQTVRIAGRNLNSPIRPNIRLLDGLIRHRVPWIQEADEPTSMRAERHATVIEQITFD